MKKLIAFALVVITLLGNALPVFACTTILVGKDASADGCAYAGRTSDGAEMDITGLKIFPACDEPGTYEYVDPENGLTLSLPKKNQRCIILPVYAKSPDLWWESGFNDAGVGISATETISIRKEILAIDPFTKTGMSEGNIPRLVLPYISSAREGVLYLADMVKKYGMTSPEAVAFIDDDGIWYMEILSGHEWAAHRLPDDEYACIGNDCLLDFYDPEDSENWMGSDKVAELAKQAGTYTELDGRFHLALSYSTGKRDYSQLRIWASRRYFNNAAPDSYDVKTQYTFSVKPEEKIALQDIFALTRDRHENTPQATDVTGTTRPIGIDRTAQAHIFQCKTGTVPVMWSCLCAPEFGVYLPVCNNVSSLPEKLMLSTPTYNENSFSWQLRLISDLAVTDRNKYSRLVRIPFKNLEDLFIQQTKQLPSPTETEADQALMKVDVAAWNTMSRVKTELITKVSENTVLATKSLGKD